VPRSSPAWLVITLTQLVQQATHRLVPAAAVRGGTAGRERCLEASLAAGQFATTLYYRGDRLRAVANLLRGVNLAERAGAPTSLTLAYARLGYVAGAAGLHPLARAYFRRANEQGRRSGDAQGLGLSLYLESFYLLSVADWERSRAAGEEAIRLLEFIGDRQESEVARTMVGHAFYYAGRFEEARERFTAILDSARARSHQHHVAWGLFLGGRSLLALGRLDEAVASLRGGYEQLRAFAHIDRTSVMCEGLLATALLRVGEVDAAVELAATLARGLREQPPPPIAPCVDAYASLAELYLALWEREPGRGASSRFERSAHRACADLRRFARALPMARPAALRSSALEQCLSGRGWRAERTWKHALAAAAERHMPYDEALVHRDLARFTTRRPEANWHHDQAQTLFARLQCADHLRRLAAA
jgi:tetratricopeptide (TPR) repeat protein